MFNIYTYLYIFIKLSTYLYCMLRDFTLKYFSCPLGLLKPFRIDYSKKHSQFTHIFLCKFFLYIWCDYCIISTSLYKYTFLIYIEGNSDTLLSLELLHYLNNSLKLKYLFKSKYLTILTNFIIELKNIYFECFLW